MPADEGRSTPPGGPGEGPGSPAGAGRFDEFVRRESELMEQIAEDRKRRISALARNLVVETIDHVQGLIEARPDRNRDS